MCLERKRKELEESGWESLFDCGTLKCPVPSLFSLEPVLVVCSKLLPPAPKFEHHCAHLLPRAKETGARDEDIRRKGHTGFLTEAALDTLLVCLSDSRHYFMTQTFI